jgi:hypothetical protein
MKLMKFYASNLGTVHKRTAFIRSAELKQIASQMGQYYLLNVLEVTASYNFRGGKICLKNQF